MSLDSSQIQDIIDALPPDEAAELVYLLSLPKSAQELEEEGCEAWYREIFGDKFWEVMGPHHREAVNWHWEAKMSQRRGEKPEWDAYFSIWSRGHMKSTLARRIAVCDACLSITTFELSQLADQAVSYCLYVSGTKGKSLGHALTIEKLISSEKLKLYYPNLCRVKKSEAGGSKGWRSNFIYTDAGCVFHFVSLDEGIRGANVDDLRPTFIVPDDVDEPEDSPAVSEKRLQVFSRSVLPTRQRGTLIFFAQNLISSYSVMNRIQSGKVIMLANRVKTEAIPAIVGLQTEVRTVNGRVKNIITGGVATWEFYDIDRCQEEIDVIGLDAFKMECQHLVDQGKRGLMLPEWDPEVHLITYEEFKKVYGVDYIPNHWPKRNGHDWGNTHPNVFVQTTQSASNSALPGIHFLNELITFDPNTLVDDTALLIIEKLFPQVDTSSVRNLDPEELAKWDRSRVTDILNAPRAVAQEKIKVQVDKILDQREDYEMWHFSHEQGTNRTIYNAIYGLPWQPCNPGKDGGISQLRHYMRIDYSQDHPFKLGKKGLAGMYFLVRDKNQLVTGKQDEAMNDDGLKLLRDQIPEWRARNLNLTDLGLSKDEPMKVHDDVGNALMMIYVHFSLEATPLTRNEQIQMQIPDGFKYKDLLAQSPYTNGLTPELELTYVVNREEASKRVQSRIRYFDDDFDPIE